MPGDGIELVTLGRGEYLRLLREDGKARSLACYVLGVLSGRGPHQGAVELIRKRCEAAVAQDLGTDGPREG